MHYFLQPKSKQKAYAPIAIGVVIGNSYGPQLKITACACRPYFIFTAIAAQNHRLIIRAFMSTKIAWLKTDLNLNYQSEQWADKSKCGADVM